MNLPKLSETQKKVVADLKQGKGMYKTVTYVVVVNGTCNVSIATFRALVNKRIIEQFGKYKRNCGMEYRLTKLGQEIIL